MKGHGRLTPLQYGFIPSNLYVDNDLDDTALVV